MSPWVHAENSAKKFGGSAKDYLPIHEFLDMTKTHFIGYQHRAILHNTFGIYICEKIFGPTVFNSDNKFVEVRYIVIEHIREDLGFVPTVKEWVDKIPYEPWMSGTTKKVLKTVCINDLIEKTND